MNVYMKADGSGGIGDYTKEPDRVSRQVLSKILEEHDVLTAQRDKRKQLLSELEKTAPAGTKAAYISFFCSESLGAVIGTEDIPAMGDVLMSAGDVDQLNLIISGPGGDGTVAEKIIELCRAYCKQFRVIVPNRAKSAATIIALGADEIVMGYCSEIGPIDAQVMTSAGGVPYWISAQSFIDARDTLEKRFHEALAKSEDPRAILQQLAVLDAPFIDHCTKLMDFSREVAKKYLERYMFSDIKPKPKRDKAIDNVLTKLSSVGSFKVHGRMIDGTAAKTDLKLKVTILGKDSPMWENIWQYYVRADVALASGVAKLIESKDEILYSHRRAAD